MTEETAKTLANALTALNKSIVALADLTNSYSTHVMQQTENTELLIRMISAKGVEEMAETIKSLPLKKRKKIYEEIIIKLGSELKLDQPEEKPVPAEKPAEEPLKG